MPRGLYIILYPCGACGKCGAYLLPSGDGIVTVRCRLCKAVGHWPHALHDLQGWRPEDCAARIGAAPAGTARQRAEGG